MLRNLTFMTNRGRLQTKEQKDPTKNSAVVLATIPDELIYPLSMHIGKASEPVVAVGDHILRGTLLAKASSFVSANIYSSVSGQVVAIEDRPTDKGMAPCIVIRNDKEDKRVQSFDAPGIDSSPEEIIEAVTKAGIVGMGGAAFPTGVKLSPPPGKIIDTLIINGAECEPYSTSDHRLMLEESDKLLEGIHLLSRLYPELKHIYLVLENNKMDAYRKLKTEIRNLQSNLDITLRTFRALYPTGAEKVLIKRLTNREVPPAGLPADVHCLVVNVSTTVAVRQAVMEGEALMERIITVTGDLIKDKKNLLVQIGTPLDSLIKDCGGFTADVSKILLGGPMMGRPVSNLQIPVTKAVTTITVLTEKETAVENRSACIMCAECINVCPVNLQPILISEAYERGDIDSAEKLGAKDCIECGNCTYICPAKIPLLDNIRKAKDAIKAREEES